MTSPVHPSSLALDLLALGQGGPDVAAHVASCDSCRDQVRASAPLPSGPVPAWVQRPPPRRLGWVLPVLVAAAAGLVGVVTYPPRHRVAPAASTRPKGFPAFAVYVEHGGRVRLWDGRSTVSAGDQLQLKVSAAGFDRLVVGALDQGTWSPLFEGPVSTAGETTLPLSFRVDADGETVQLGLLWCDHPCPVSDLPAAAKVAPRDAHRWWTFVALRREETP